MKRIALILLAGVLVLPAVEWDKERITDDMRFHVNPVLVLDSHGHARVLYIEMDEESGESWLKLASNETGSWDINEVTPLSSYYYEYELYYLQTHSLALDSEDNTYVVFFDLTSDELSDLYLATDITGDFEVDALTSDSLIQVAPIVQIDAGDQVTMVYLEGDPMTETAVLRYGWFDQGELVSELITDNVYFEDYITPIDFILGNTDTPHAFYTGSDYYLWHAEPSLSHLQGWNSEHVSSIPYAITPSAARDAADKLHVAYRAGEMDIDSLMYATDKSGAWQEELVTQTGEPFYDWYDVPSISLNPQGTPYIVWGCYWGDYWFYGLHYSAKTVTGWFNEDISDTLGGYEVPAMGHYFAIDSEGYGHLVYAAETEYTWQIYYAKSMEPLGEVGITEQPLVSNPFDLEIRGSTIHFSLPASGMVSLDLYDASGRRVCCIASGIYAAGEHSVPINSDRLPTGVYFVRAEIQGRSASAKFVLTH